MVSRAPHAYIERELGSVLCRTLHNALASSDRIVDDEGQLLPQVLFRADASLADVGTVTAQASGSMTRGGNTPLFKDVPRQCALCDYIRNLEINLSILEWLSISRTSVLWDTWTE